MSTRRPVSMPARQDSAPALDTPAAAAAAAAAATPAAATPAAPAAAAATTPAAAAGAGAALGERALVAWLPVRASKSASQSVMLFLRFFKGLFFKGPPSTK